MTATADVVIRSWRQADLPRLVELDAEIFGPASWSEVMYEAEYAMPDRHYLVSESASGELTGWAGALIGPESHLMTVAVLPAYRRQGIASQLVAALVAAAREAGAQSMILEVRADDTGAQELYSKYEFRNIAVRKNYFPGDWEDAIVMKRDFRSDLSQDGPPEA